MLEAAIERCRKAPLHHPEGVVLEVVGLIVEIGGIRAAVGDTLEIQAGTSAAVEVEVIGFKADRLVTTPLGALAGIRQGARVTHTHRGASVKVGKELLGRVVDAFGRPMDGGPPMLASEHYPVHASPPSAFTRRPIDKQFSTGIRVIDGMLPVGIGQRMGIFAGAGVGKSTLLGMICRSSQADVNVVGLIGERGRELNDFIRSSLGADGLSRSIVVAVTSDQPPLLRARGAESATAIAEYFRDQGKTVLLVMDSVTRYAMALREAALAAGEPPATKGYPPSVFAALPRLLERAGTGGGAGTISALYTVLVEGDDMTDPVADAVRGILDGHIIMSRELAEKGHYPAIDVLQSISRLAPEIAPDLVLRASAQVREILAAYRDAADLIQVGAYQAGSDPRVELALKVMPHFDAYLRQTVSERTQLMESRTRIQQLAKLCQAGERR
ncbi:MAG TPA: FliI/YscN family ATPase [Polyangiaceae bacterium]